MEIIDSLWQYVLLQFQDNEFLVGGVGAGIFAALLYTARSAPSRIWNWIKMVSTSKITITSDEDYAMINKTLLYLQKRKPFIRQSKFSSIGTYNEEDDVRKKELGIGYGSHFYMIGGRPALVNYTVDENAKLNDMTRRIISITILSRYPHKIFDKIINEADKEGSESKSMDVKVFAHGGWRYVSNIGKRYLSSVTMSDEQREKITTSVEGFLESKEDCREMGIPWSHSILLYGKPGTGKSSLAMAIGTEYDLPIYYMNLSSIKSDSQLEDAFRDMEPRSILLMEDIDGFAILNDRSGDENKSKTTEEGPTTSGLLNCMSGLMTPDGLLTIMTTNHPEKIDPAFMRPGRVDDKILVDRLTPDLAAGMYQRLTGELVDDTSQFADLTGAEVERMAKEHNAIKRKEK